ncbi:hypothetical protein GALL_447410 [mine drainage metagenome]|uniref:Uncharacterized protein n=1 Tax=mine drainage metagenome TaxID=410659 RepID=A0A1J5QCC2_9ZZZZ
MPAQDAIAAILVQVAAVYAIGADDVAGHLADIGTRALAFIVRDEGVDVGHRDQLLSRIAQHVGQRRVAVEDAAICGNEFDPDARVVEGGLQHVAVPVQVACQGAQSPGQNRQPDQDDAGCKEEHHVYGVEHRGEELTCRDGRHDPQASLAERGETHGVFDSCRLRHHGSMLAMDAQILGTLLVVVIHDMVADGSVGNVGQAPDPACSLSADFDLRAGLVALQTKNQAGHRGQRQDDGYVAQQNSALPDRRLDP